jgi:tRNA dimethylallyltransferase
MPEKTCIIICGPTASGKTNLSIQLARQYDTAIISADSRQCYQELDIGVARPSKEELAVAKHYFIATHSVNDTVNAAVYEQYALDSVNEIFKTADVAVMVGGTGLYIRAFCQGMDEIPPVPEAITRALQQKYDSNGIEWLQQQVEKQDPLYFAGGEIHNPHRLLRALGVQEATGKSIREFQKRKTVQRPFNIIKAGIDLPRPVLYDRINERVNQMMDDGLLKEAERLFPLRHLKALQTVGYTELFGFLEGKQTLEASIHLIKQRTRHYAKRQITWFKKEEGIHWNENWSVKDLTFLVETKKEY